MTNKEIILSKESKIIVITRDMSLYWFGKFNDKYLMYSLCQDINRELDEYWDDDLLAKRDSNWSYNLPRDKDVIFIFEIIDEITFFHVLRKCDFMVYDHLEHYAHKKYVEQIYERIDGVFEKR